MKYFGIYFYIFGIIFVSCANATSNKMYGQYGDDPVVDSRALYGKYNEGPHTMDEKLVMPKKPVVKKAFAIKPIIAKPAAAPIEKNPIKTASAKSAKQISEKLAPNVVKIIKAEQMPEPKIAKPIKPVVAPVALQIASVTKARSIDDFCVDMNLPVKGKLPKGFVLMFGAPDKMCCITK